MSDDAPRNDTNRRKIKLETRFGSARQSRSRKDRPCDLCRGRKSACVIAVKPPCRLCESRGLQCTFTSEPSRKRTAAQQSSSIPQDETSSDASLGRAIQKSAVTSPITSSKRDQSPRDTWEPQLAYEQSPVLSNAITPESANLQLPQIIPSQTASSPISFSSPQRIFYRNPQSKDDPILSGGHEYSLEDAKDLTAHFIGLSGEQDTDLLASIRYNVLNETSFVDFNIHKVYSGNSTQNKPPIHFSIVHDSFPERDQRAKRSASDAIEHHVRGHSDALLRLYFRFVHPIFPILSKARILRTYASDKLRIPASLRGVMYGLACAFWDQDQTLRGSLRVTQPELFEYAHVALNRELDSPKLSTLQACLLLLHEQPDAHGTTESPKVWTYACQATACAQSLGLHQDPSSWRTESWEKSLRRKLWWATYWTDRWTSICHGHPPHITDDSFDTKELELEDLSVDEDVVGLPGWSLVAENERTFNVSSALRFLESLSLSRLLSDMLKSSFTLQSYAQSYDRITGNIKDDIERNRTLNERIANLPGILSMDTSYPHPNINGPLHLSIFALKFLTLRALMAPVRSTSKSNPLSNLCRHFECALIEGQTFVKFVSALRPTDIHVFWPRHSRTHLIIAANFLIYLFFGASTERQVTEAYEMLQQLQDDLRFMADMADWSTIGLIRPALLRVDSFFHGAAKGIRDAGTE